MPGAALLDAAPVTAAEYAAVEDRCRELLATKQAAFVFQGEATVALEAVARGLGRPAWRALNVVSGPYGAAVGNWMAQAGAQVDNVLAPPGQAVGLEQVEAALKGLPSVDVVSLVHAEAATGVRNDVERIAEAAHSHGALVVVDAVASVGAEPLAIDTWALDLVVLSAQKALAGPSGVSIVVISTGAWEALASHPSPWRGSVLSLLDWKDLWVSTDRRSLPVIPSHLETRALGAAIERAAEEGLDQVVGRHRAAGAAARAALSPLGLEPWVHQDDQAAAVATLVRAPAGGARALLEAALGASGELSAPIAPAPGSLAGDIVRVNHTGRRANLNDVTSAVTALGRGLQSLGHGPDLAGAVAVATDTWRRALEVRT
jgi:aspartate aminotransferase-like enzyme